MLVKYQPKSQPLRWQKSHYSPLGRQIEVFTVVGRFISTILWDNFWANKSGQIRKKRAAWLIKNLLNLGPTFIKIGQALSTRADILPPEYIEELSKLQDQVPPFSVEEAVALIESELGKPLYAIYKDFDRVPLAAASLGQVHRAKLHNNQEVVVKIQRPGLEKLFDLDLKAVHNIIAFCRRYFSWIRKYDIESIYQEFFTVLYQEIDYIQEGKNSDKFRENFKGYSRVIVPQVYWEYTTHKILTIEYVPGIKIDDLEKIKAVGLDPQFINQLGVCCYLKQLLIDGFFQADPHPGNLALSNDGSLIFYDFGMMVDIKSLTKDEMIKTFFAVLKKDTDQVLKTLIALGLIEPVPDMRPVRRLVDFLLEQFTEKPIDFKLFQEVKDELYVMFEQQPFRLPSQMIFILKSITTLDGIARSLDPQYNLIACAKPFIKTITATESKLGLFGELAKQAQEFIRYKWQQPSKTQVLFQKLEKRLEYGELQIQVTSIESDRHLKRINIALKSLIYACLSGFTFLGGIILLVQGYQGGSIAFLSIASFLCLLMIRSLINLSLREKLDNIAQK